MRSTTLKTLSPVIILCFLFLASCKKDKCVQTVTYKTYLPIYMSYDELRSSVKSMPAQALVNPGKIYLKDNYIFVNEINKGIHVIDNSNPSSPQNIAFINIPGNVDMAAVDNTLYADNAVDLLAIDISNPSNITILKRVENALPTQQYYGGYYSDPSKGLVVGWEEKMVTDTVNNNCNGNTPVYYNGPMLEGDVKANNTPVTFSPTTSGGNPGIGGSSARFTIAGNALYIVDNSTLHVYNISMTSNPVKVSDQNVGWSIETIFPYKNHLFIGSNAGVYIYDNTNPLNPVYVSVYNHMTACDPVVVDDHYAYFTLSNDAPCHMGVNDLEVVDISDIVHPTLVVTVPMTNPKGLGIDNKKLFICDSQDGLKVYDATDVMKIADNQIAHFSDINSADVIPYNNHLLMTGKDGLYQYDYSDIKHIQLLSKILVTSK